jgi:hypothetical protein
VFGPSSATAAGGADAAGDSQQLTAALRERQKAIKEKDAAKIEGGITKVLIRCSYIDVQTMNRL